MTPRELRLWHYRQRMRMQQNAESMRNLGDYRLAAIMDATAKFHAEAVSAMDEVVSGTVVEDAEDERALQAAQALR